eukprot:scaffold4734_cov176-Ochromonas_danica.AAC.3
MSEVIVVDLTESVPSLPQPQSMRELDMEKDFEYDEEMDEGILSNIEESMSSFSDHVERNREVVLWYQQCLPVLKVAVHGPIPQLGDCFVCLVEDHDPNPDDLFPLQEEAFLLGSQLPVKVIFATTTDTNTNTNTNTVIEIDTTNTNSMIMTSKKWQTGYILSLEDADQDGYLIWHLVGDVLVGEKMLPQDFHLSALQREDKKVLKRISKRAKLAKAVTLPNMSGDMKDVICINIKGDKKRSTRESSRPHKSAAPISSAESLLSLLGDNGGIAIDDIKHFFI